MAKIFANHLGCKIWMLVKYVKLNIGMLVQHVILNIGSTYEIECLNLCIEIFSQKIKLLCEKFVFLLITFIGLVTLWKHDLIQIHIICIWMPVNIKDLTELSHFYSTSSSPLLLRSAPDTVRILCRRCPCNWMLAHEPVLNVTIHGRLKIW